MRTPSVSLRDIGEPTTNLDDALRGRRRAPNDLSSDAVCVGVSCDARSPEPLGRCLIGFVVVSFSRGVGAVGDRDVLVHRAGALVGTFGGLPGVDELRARSS